MYEIEYLEIERKKEYEEIINKVLKKCFNQECLENSKMYIELILTNSEEIRKFNKKYRNIDKKTDVLSFPMFEKEEIDEKIKIKNFQNEDILGNIIISIQKVEEQAKEYQHSFEREFAYMIVHGFYHLMGYDHIKENEKENMRQKEEIILNNLKITRR